MLMKVPTTGKEFRAWLEGTDFGKAWIRKQQSDADTAHRQAHAEMMALIVERDRRCVVAVANERAAEQRVSQTEAEVQRARLELLQRRQETQAAQRHAEKKIAQLERALERAADTAYPEIDTFILEQQELRNQARYVAIESSAMVYPDKYAFLKGRKVPVGHWTNAAALDRLLQASLNAERAARALVYQDVDDITAEIARLRLSVPPLSSLDDREPTFDVTAIMEAQ